MDGGLKAIRFPIVENAVGNSHDDAQSVKTVVIENGVAIMGPPNEDAQQTHVYRRQSDGVVYSVSLSSTDVKAGINSFFTMQIKYDLDEPSSPPDGDESPIETCVHEIIIMKSAQTLTRMFGAK